MTFKIFSLIFSLILIIGCDKTYTKNECELLSMKSYKGDPLASHQFKSNCLKFKIKYTHEACQEALTYLIKTADLTKVQVKYGDPIVDCFTKNDLENFLN